MKTLWLVSFRPIGKSKINDTYQSIFVDSVKSLNGDIKASNNLSSNSLEVFKTIFFTLFTINLANIPLIKRAMIKDKMIMPRLKRLTPRTPF